MAWHLQGGGSTWRLVSTKTQRRLAKMPLSGGNFQATFQTGGTPTPLGSTAVSPGALRFDLTEGHAQTIVPGSVNFTVGGKQYYDREGTLFTDLDVASGVAVEAGSINYSTGEINLTYWTNGATNGVTLRSMMAYAHNPTVTGVTFRVPVAPVVPGSLQILATKELGGNINVTANINGEINSAGVRGAVDYDSGVVGIEFGEWVTAAGNESEPWYRPENVDGSNVWKPEFVFADTLRFNAVGYSYLPLDADVLGLDPVRLPSDGRVPIFRRGGFAVLGHTKVSGTITAVDAATFDTERTRLSRARVIGSDGVAINEGWSVDLETGVVTFEDTDGWAQPVRVEDRVEDLVQVSDVQISGQLAFTRQVSHAYPAGATVSSVLMAGDLKARVPLLFDQASWNNTWSDIQQGDAAVGTYNTTISPIEVANYGAITERWILRFTSTTAFQIIGEHVGVIGVSTINEDTSPINPATGTPYFTIRELGWGTGWANGNIVRLNTIGAQFPVWAIRTVQQGAETVLDDTFELIIRGDVDRP